MVDFKIHPIKPTEGQQNTGALKADAGDNKKKFNELIAAAYAGATGPVPNTTYSPTNPSGHIPMTGA